MEMRSLARSAEEIQHRKIWGCATSLMDGGLKFAMTWYEKPLSLRTFSAYYNVYKKIVNSVISGYWNAPLKTASKAFDCLASVSSCFSVLARYASISRRENPLFKAALLRCQMTMYGLRAVALLLSFTHNMKTIYAQWNRWSFEQKFLAVLKMVAKLAFLYVAVTRLRKHDYKLQQVNIVVDRIYKWGRGPAFETQAFDPDCVEKKVEGGVRPFEVRNAVMRLGPSGRAGFIVESSDWGKKPHKTPITVTPSNAARSN